MYPSERSLVKKLANEPFALIGVNSDRDREALKKVIQKENITWRSFWNGGGTSGPISSAWRVTGWPTIFVIDAEGIVRYKTVGSNEAGTAQAIQECLDRLKAKSR
jgi:peroxiredoxin